MKALFKKFLKISTKSKYEKEFFKLSKQSEIRKLFNLFISYESIEIRFVGGCVRKILNNEIVDDLDLAINLEPSDVKNILKKNNINFFETGIDHGTITAVINNFKFEITSLRKDVDTDGRHAIVEFTKDWSEDASRRDFTINAIYSDLDGNLFDPFNGKSDLKSGHVKFIGNAENRIREDYLRILRYLRFFTNYSEHDHDEKIKKIVKQNISGVKNLSNDRLLDELKKLFYSPKFFNILDDQFSLEILDLVFPELKNFKLISKLKNLKLSEKISFISFICICVVDETDNSEYFLYKYNISNENKKRVIFLKKYFNNLNDKNFFTKNNLSKLHYKYGPSLLNDLIFLKILRSKKTSKELNKLREFFLKKEKPQFPIKAKLLIEKYKMKEGRELGKKLETLEQIWLNNNFKISDDDIREQIIN